MTSLRFSSERFRRRSAEGYVRIIWLVLLGSFLLFPFLTDHGHTGLTCQFHKMTGLSCPTCGMSRSLYELVRLHIAASFKYHLFGPVVYLTGLLLFLKVGAEIVTGRRIRSSFRPVVLRKMLYYTAMAWVIFWLARMYLEYKRMI